MDKNQLQIIEELVRTERNYVKDMQDVVQVYEPCFHLLNTITREDIEIIFSNIEAILELSRSLLGTLSAADTDPVKIADCFLDKSLEFRVYSVYCTSYHRANERLFELKQENSVLSTILLDLQRSLGHSLPLSSYLHKPVQRILKYHLILKNLLRSCDDEASRYKLQEAYDCMARCADEINNSKRLTEMDVKTRELHELLLAVRETDHFGKLVREGEMTGQDGSSHPETMFVYLFENVLVLCHRVQDMFALHKILRCAELLILEDNSTKETEFTVVPFSSPNQSLTLRAKSLAQKLDWCIQLHKRTDHKIPNKAKKLLLSNAADQKEETSPSTQSKRQYKRRPSLPLLSPNSIGRRVKRSFREGVTEIMTKSRSSVNLRRSSSAISSTSSVIRNYGGSLDTISLKSDLSASSDGTSRTGGSKSTTGTYEQAYDEISPRATKLHNEMNAGDLSQWHTQLVTRINQFKSPKHRAIHKKLGDKKRSKSCIELTTTNDELCSSDTTSDLSATSSKAGSQSARVTSSNSFMKKNLMETKSQILRKIVRWRRRARNQQQDDRIDSPSVATSTTSSRRIPSFRNNDEDSGLATVSDYEEDNEVDLDLTDKTSDEKQGYEDENSNDSIFELNISENFSDSLIECFNNVLQPTA